MPRKRKKDFENVVENNVSSVQDNFDETKTCEKKSSDSSRKLFEFVEVNIDDIFPNEWNVNEMKPDVFNRLVKEIKEVGYIEPIQVVSTEGGKYKIIGGEHRYFACKFLGYKKLPCIVLKDEKFKDENLQKFISVRLNVLRGKINPEKFVKLYDELADKYGADNLQELLGIVDTKEYNNLLKDIGRSLVESGVSKDKADEFVKKSEKLKSLDSIGDLLNEIMVKHGNTLEYDFMIFNYGGKNIYWFKVDKKVKKILDDICEKAVCDKKKISKYLYRIFETFYDLQFEDKLDDSSS